MAMPGPPPIQSGEAQIDVAPLHFKEEAHNDPYSDTSDWGTETGTLSALAEFPERTNPFPSLCQRL
jgi:hypothetical protein